MVQERPVVHPGAPPVPAAGDRIGGLEALAGGSGNILPVSVAALIAFLPLGLALAHHAGRWHVVAA